MIPVLCPTIDKQTKKELLEVLDSGWWGQGPKTFEFEKKFARYVGARYAIATNSGTSALDLCLKVYGIRGGELITTAFTFVSDAIVGEWNDMDVSFADIDPNSLCLDPSSMVLSESVKAIIAVDSHGRLVDWEQMRYMANLMPKPPLLIEDAAHAMYTPGVGRLSDICMYSFQAVKSMPLWDGGMITTDSEEIYKKLRTLTWLGVEKTTYERADAKRYSWDYDITQGDGTKSYMTDVQSVVALGQLRRLSKTNARRREIQSVYNKAFYDIHQIKTPMHSETVQYYTMTCERRDELGQFLANKGIATSVHFKPLSEMTYWKKAVKRPLPVTDAIWVNLLSLPVHNALTDDQLQYIIKCVKEFYA